MKANWAFLVPSLFAAVSLAAAAVPSGDRGEGRGDLSFEAAQAEGGDLRDRVALLGELEVGVELGGWSVRAIDGRSPERIGLRASRQGAAMWVTVAVKGASSFRPPVSTATRDLFYGSIDSSAGPAPGREEIDALLQAVAARVRAHEGRALP